MKSVAALLLLFSVAVQAEPLKIGSKRFTESYILGEIIVRTAGDAVHRQGLGNTGIVFGALKAGDRKSTRLNSSHIQKSRMPSSA